MAGSLWRYFSDLRNFLHSYFLCSFLYQTLRGKKTWTVCALVVSLMMNPGFCMLLFLIFSFVYFSQSPVTDCNEHGKTHTSPMESLPGPLVCASICVHSIISPGSRRNWRITDLDWMLLTSGGCLFPVVDKHRLNHCLLNQCPSQRLWHHNITSV